LKGKAANKTNRLEWWRVNQAALLSKNLVCPFVSMYTDTEWDTLPRVILTGDDEWNTNIIEHTNNNYFDAFANLNG